MLFCSFSHQLPKSNQSSVCNIFALFEYFQSINIPSFPSLAFDSQNMLAVYCVWIWYKSRDLCPIHGPVCSGKWGLQGLPSLGCWYPNGFMVLHHDASLMPQADAGGNHPSTKIP